MSKRKVYHVTPDGEGGWDVKAESAQRSSAHFENKADAVTRGKQLAKSNPLGQIKIHKQDGKIQTEHTYEKDPHPPKG